MVTSSDLKEIALLRATAQGLFAANFATPAAAVQGLLATQAQDLAAAKWAVARRTPAATLTEVNAALDAGEIVRSWPMRGTLHFVAPEDLGWMLQLTTGRLLKQAATRHKELGLDSAIFEQARELATHALAGGRHMSRDEFQTILEQNGISTAGGRGYHVIWYLAQTSTLCWGPTAANAQNLVLLDEWVKHSRNLDRDEALAEYVVRYVRGHGPATIHDFVWWSKLTVADAKRGLAVAGSLLTERRYADVSYWVTAESDGDVPDAAQKRRFAASVALLPAFDEYFLGYRDRTASADLAHHERIIPGKNGVFQPIIVAGGRVVGLWKRRTVGRNGLAISAEPFEPLSATHAAGVRRESRRYARYAGLTPQND